MPAYKPPDDLLLLFITNAEVWVNRDVNENLLNRVRRWV